MSKIIGVTVGTPTSPKRIAEEIVPQVTSEDNGKVMIVNDGEWSVGVLPKILPEATTDDEGKFLRVVDGAYALVTLTDVSTEGL